MEVLKRKGNANKLQTNSYEKVICSKKELKRIDWNIVKRLVIFLHYNKMKKTNIAMQCSMSYDKCVLYLNWLEMMDLIKKETDPNGFEVICLNDKGNELYERKFNDTLQFA